LQVKYAAVWHKVATGERLKVRLLSAGERHLQEKFLLGMASAQNPRACSFEELLPNGDFANLERRLKDAFAALRPAGETVEEGGAADAGAAGSGDGQAGKEGILGRNSTPELAAAWKKKEEEEQKAKEDKKKEAEEEEKKAEMDDAEMAVRADARLQWEESVVIYDRFPGKNEKVLPSPCMYVFPSPPTSRGKLGEAVKPFPAKTLELLLHAGSQDMLAVGFGHDLAHLADVKTKVGNVSAVLKKYQWDPVIPVCSKTYVEYLAVAYGPEASRGQMPTFVGPTAKQPEKECRLGKCTVPEGAMREDAEEILCCATHTKVAPYLTKLPKLTQDGPSPKKKKQKRICELTGAVIIDGADEGSGDDEQWAEKNW